MTKWLKIIPCLGMLTAGVIYLANVTEMSHASEWTVSRQDGQPASDSSVFPAMSSATNIGAAIMVTSNTLSAASGNCCTTTWPGVLYGVHVSSVSSQSMIVFRDTDTANITSPVLAAVQAPMNSTAPVVVQFNPPLRFRNGLSGSAGSCDARRAADGVCYTVLYDVR